MRIHVLGWLVVCGAAAAQQPAAPTVTATSTFRVEAGQDVFFASDHLTGMRLVHLRADGTFAEYAREHMFVGLVDRGRWRQDGDDVLWRCSHHRFEPIRAGDLSVWPRQDDVTRLAGLAGAIEERLSARSSAQRLGTTDLAPVVLRSIRAAGKLLPGSLTPVVKTFDDTASRSDLVALSAAIRQRLASRDGSLVARGVKQRDGLVWLAEPDRDVEADLLEQARHHTEGPFLPAMIAARVDAATFAQLLGTRQAFQFLTEMNRAVPREAGIDDMLADRVSEPECGPYADLARPLPSTTAIGAAPRRR